MKMNSADQIRAFVADLRHQIGVAEDAGADHTDLCVVFPAGYIALAAGWPTIDLDGQAVALVPKLYARDRADEAVAESSFAPPADTGSQHLGLWSESPAFGDGLRRG